MTTIISPIMATIKTVGICADEMTAPPASVPKAAPMSRHVPFCATQCNTCGLHFDTYPGATTELIL